MTHRDVLEALNHPIPARDKLCRIHEWVRGLFPFVARIAVTTYDPGTQVLKEYLHSGTEQDPMAHYSARLDCVPSLEALRREGRARVIEHPVTREQETSEHQRRIGRYGYAASYTLPMFCNGEFFGFIFFNSTEPEVFSEAVLGELDVVGHMVSLLVINELSSARTLLAATRATQHIARLRDNETGAHLDRMARYARLIAASLADECGFDDAFVEHLFLFAPLHDIGKIGIPDEILLKPGRLDDGERSVMQTHARKGREIIDEVVGQFGLHALEHIEMMRNIIEYHHEKVDGGGYPEGIAGRTIPIEARIVAVADVFDALTSARPYKPAWSNDEAFEYLLGESGRRFDGRAVAALIAERAAVEQIQATFRENPFG